MRKLQVALRLRSIVNEQQTLSALWPMQCSARFPLRFAVALLFGAALHADDNAVYRVPSPPLVAVVDAPVPPVPVLSPDRKTLLLLDRPPAPSIAELAQPELRLAGLRINPAVNGQSLAAPCFTSLPR